MECGRASNSAQAAMVRLPITVGCGFSRKNFERRTSRLKGDDPAAISLVPQRFAELGGFAPTSITVSI